MSERESQNRIFFQSKYAWANNWGNPVGFANDELLRLACD